MKRITKFKLISGGDKGIEIHGVAITKMDGRSVAFSDDVIIKRRFPVSWKMREQINRLRYPVMVMSMHWRPEFSNFMDEEFHDIDYAKIDPKDKVAGTLQTLWEGTLIQEASFDRGKYRITGDVVLDNAKMKLNALIEQDNSYDLYSMVEGILNELADEIMLMISNPLAEYTSDDARRILNKISSGTEEESEISANSEDTMEEMLLLSTKKGFGVVIDDEMLEKMSHAAIGEHGKDSEEEASGSLESMLESER